MKCEYCDNPVPNGVTRCPSCGAVISFQITNEPCQNRQQEVTVPMPQHAEDLAAQPLLAYQQSRAGYMLLGFFLGEIGLHNFYAGYVWKGIAQLSITVLSLGLLCWISWIWAVIEIAMVTKNAKGVPFR